MRTPVAVVLTITALLSGTRVTAQTSPGDERAVLDAVQTLFRSMQTKDTALMRSVFDPGARLVGIRTGKDGNSFLQSLSIDQFVGFLGRDARPDWTERAFEPRVMVSGTLAQVWAEYDFHFGTQFSHCGIDAVQLLKVGQSWKIVSIADTFTREGCPEHPAP